MSRFFPRALLAEALGDNPRLIAAFEEFDQALEDAEAKMVELETRAAAVEAATTFQPRSAILDSLSGLDGQIGAIEQISVGQFAIRSIDDPNDSAALLTRITADSLYAPQTI